MNLERIKLALVAMERKSDAATHALKTLQNKMLGFDKAESQAQKRQLQSIENVQNEELTLMVAIAKWHGSTDHLVKRINDERKIVEEQLIAAKAEAADCRMRLEALREIQKRKLKEAAADQQRNEQNQFPFTSKKLL